MDPKEAAARKALELVEDGMVVGLGTGSTSRLFVEVLAGALQGGLSIRGVASSSDTEGLARSLGIPLVDLDDIPRVDLTVDGADEVDPDFNLIKGLGGALVREKILASVSDLMAVIVDSSKLTPRLGSRAPVPVEVVPFGTGPCRRRLEQMGAAVTLRRTDRGAFVSDNGNHILDARFDEIPDPAGLDGRIDSIPGVVANGLFVGMAGAVVVGTEKGATLTRKGEGPIP